MSSCSQVAKCRSDVLYSGQALTLAPFSNESYKKFALQPFMEGLRALHSVFEIIEEQGWITNRAIRSNPKFYLLPEVGYFFSSAQFSFWSKSNDVKEGADLKEDVEDAIHRYIALAFQKMSTAEEVSLAQVDALGSNAEELRNQQKSLNDNKNSLEEQLHNLNLQLSTLHKELENNTSKLESAHEVLESINSDLKRAESDQHHYGVVRDVGIGMFFIPFIGPIIGSIMVGVGATSANDSKRRADEAAHNVHAQEAIVDRCKQECTECQESIADTEKSIAASDRKIEDLQGEIEQNVAFQQKLQDFLIPLKRCTTFLSSMAGKTRVANRLAELKVTIKTLLPVLEDIEKTICPLIRDNEN